VIKGYDQGDTIVVGDDRSSRWLSSLEMIDTKEILSSLEMIDTDRLNDQHKGDRREETVVGLLTCRDKIDDKKIDYYEDYM
jgi:hypothetical protein